MDTIQLNPAVYMYSEPVFGTVSAEKRVMALAVDNESKKTFPGLAREITRSKGSVDIPGFVDESKLILVESKDCLKWEKISDLKIKGIEDIIKKLEGNEKFFIGLEDPDIWQENELKHVYFTIAFKLKTKEGYNVYLGHAQGDSLENLTATEPVLGPIYPKIDGFKESCISPIKTPKGRLNLNEIIVVGDYEGTSAISISETYNLGEKWQYKTIALHPKMLGYDWCSGHLSPCRFFPDDFVSFGNLLVGLVNGREKTREINGKRVYGKFRPGLILFDPQSGEIPWIAEKPLFEDPDARTITFASDFIRTSKKEGILYCHVNDSFIRAYKINGQELQKYIDKNCDMR